MPVNQSTTKKRFQRIGLWGGLVVVIAIVATPALPLIAWVCILYGGTFWQQYLVPGTIPEYDGMSLTLNEGKVEGIAFGFTYGWPNDVYFKVNEKGKHVSQLSPTNAAALDMIVTPSTHSNLYYRLGEAGESSFACFNNGRLTAFFVRHSSIKLSKTPTGPFFSLPISFEEFQKMFGKPKHWRREGVTKRVP